MAIFIRPSIPQYYTMKTRDTKPKKRFLIGHLNDDEVIEVLNKIKELEK